MRPRLTQANGRRVSNVSMSGSKEGTPLVVHEINLEEIRLKADIQSALRSAIYAVFALDFAAQYLSIAGGVMQFSSETDVTASMDDEYFEQLVDGWVRKGVEYIRTRQ